MRSLSVRELQHHLSASLKAVDRGEEIEVTHRGRPVALIVPIPAAGADSDWSGAKERLHQHFPGLSRGKAVSEIIDEGRGTQ